MSTSVEPFQPFDPDPPEAPSPAPVLELYMRVRENDAANEYEGGRVILASVLEGKPADLLDATLLISAKTDAYLMQLPWKTRAAKQTRFFRLRLEEVPIAEVPPDPALLTDIAAAEARLEQLRAAKEGR